MASEIGICNSALSKIGTTNRISSLTEDSKNAQACNEQYAKLRDDLLRGHVWNFAKARIKLAKNATAPTYEFDNAFTLPADWLRTVAVHDNDAGDGTTAYRLEGRQVLSSADELWLTYVKQETDPNTMPADFREALAYRLAVELALPIAQSNTVQASMERLFVRKLRQAKSTDGIEDQPENLPAGSWVTGRN